MDFSAQPHVVRIEWISAQHLLRINPLVGFDSDVAWMWWRCSSSRIRRVQTIRKSLCFLRLRSDAIRLVQYRISERGAEVPAYPRASGHSARSVLENFRAPATASDFRGGETSFVRDFQRRDGRAGVAEWGRTQNES